VFLYEWMLERYQPLKARVYFLTLITENIVMSKQHQDADGCRNQALETVRHFVEVIKCFALFVAAVVINNPSDNFCLV
jgi:hypothetical protein